MDHINISASCRHLLIWYFLPGGSFRDTSYCVFTAPFGTSTLLSLYFLVQLAPHGRCSESKVQNAVWVSPGEGVPSGRLVWTAANCGVGSVGYGSSATCRTVLPSLTLIPCLPFPAFVLSGSFENHIYVLHIWQGFLVKTKNLYNVFLGKRIR